MKEAGLQKELSQPPAQESFLLLPPKCWDYRYEPPLSHSFSALSNLSH
ncbi:rCG56132 [Rattus norvegicus]|uniref:RCG56132 n=1 Tax=Rattus norvegicus TaxID=10116 RepID=A6IAM3_RAT|nr:rCG56132 [Rattus norvegicus]